MFSAKAFLAQLSQRNFSVFSGVPCSLLGPIMERVQTEPGWRYVPAANEGDAVAVAAGAELGGLRSVVLMQNSGLGNAVNPLTSLNQTYRIPVLLMVSWRGDPDAAQDAHQHQLMGRATPKILDAMEIPWQVLPSDKEQLSEALDEAEQTLTSERRPFCFIVKKGTFNDGCELPNPRLLQPTAPAPTHQPEARHYRPDFLKALIESAPEAILLASTGYTGRELCGCADRANQFYMAGSMGCCSSLGLGLAIAQPKKRVVVLDGDAALTMRLGSVASVARECPENLVHIVFDNAVNESTGGQLTPSAGIDFCAIARACGYRSVSTCSTPEAMLSALEQPGPVFCHTKVLSGFKDVSPRPELPPEEITERLKLYLRQAAI